MAKPGGLTHILVELSTLDELSSLLRRSARLKYTCFSVSKKYIALGSNTGGVYIFSRDSQKYLQVVFGDTSSNPVVCVSLSPNDQFVGLALSTGLVAVFELNIEKRAKPERVRHTQDHTGHQVTAFTWDSVSSKMFVGDDTGKVSIVFVPLNKGQTLFAVPSEVIAYLNCSVYQMDWWKDKLLVSTITHTHLFDTTKHNFSTIGKKIREGEFGSCFFLEPSSKCSVIYSARPGSRMWEVDFEGKVLNTHQFKQLLAVQPIPVVEMWNESFEIQANSSYSPQSANFYKMFRMSQFIVTWSSKGLYFFDPINVKVLIWTQSIKDIKDMAVYNNNVYLFLGNASVHKLTLLPIYQLFTVLATRRHWSLMASLLVSADQISMRPAIVKKVKQDLLQSLFTGLRESGKTQLIEKVRSVMEDVSEGSIDSLGAGEDFMDSSEFMGHTYLPSGMVVVSEGVQIKDGGRKVIVENSQPGMKVIDTVGHVGVENVYTTGGDNMIKIEPSNPDFSSEKNGTEDKNQFDSDKLHGETDSVENGISVCLTRGDGEDEQRDNLQCNEGISNKKENSDHQLVKDKQFTNNVDKNDTYIRLGDSSVSNSNNKLSSTVDGSTHATIDFDSNNKEHTDEVVDSDGEEASGADQSMPDSERDTVNLDQNENLKNSLIDDDKNVNELSRNYHFVSTPGKSSFPHHLTNGNTQQAIGNSVTITTSSAPGTEVDGAGLSFLSNTTLPVTISRDNTGDGHLFSRENNMQGESIVIDSPASEIGSGSDLTSNKANANKAQGFSENISVLSSQDIYKPNEASKAEFQDSANTPQLSLVSEPSNSDDKEAIENCHNQSKSNINTESQSPTFSNQQPSPTVSFNDYKALEEVAGSPNRDILNSSHVTENNNNATTLDGSKSSVNLTGKEATHPSVKFLPLDFSQSKDTEIAKPLRKSKKKKHKKSGSSQDARIVNFSNSSTIEEDTTEPAEEFKRRDYDTVSIGTISSIEEEGEVNHSGGRTPDSVSLSEDVDSVSSGLTASLSVSPTSHRELSPARKSSYDENKTQVIPPLIDRLAAARGSVTSEDGLYGREDSPIHSPLTMSGEHGQMATSPRSSLSSIREELSMKLKTQTKSLIKTFKEKNPLLTKSSSSPTLAGLTDQQQKIWKDEHNFQAGDDHLTQSQELHSESQPVKEEEAASVIDVSGLYFKALSIQKKLNSPSVLLKPKSLHQILNEWSRELCEALVLYHKELLKREKEKQREGKHLEDGQNKKGEDDEDNGIELKPATENHKVRTGTDGEHFKFGDISNKSTKDFTSSSGGTEFQPASTDANSVAAENVSLTSQSTATGFKEPGGQCLDPSYWSNISHTQDPFHLSQKQLDIFKTLTTMCFTCGATGNILDFLNFSEEKHYSEFFKAVLPQPLISLYNPASDRLTSLFPENLRTSHLESVSVQQNDLREKNQENSHEFKKESSDDPSLYASKFFSAVFPNEKIQNHVGSLEPTKADKDFEVTPKIVVGGELSLADKNTSTCSDLEIATQSLSCLQEAKEDLSLALFTRLFFFVLDYETVKRTLDNHENKLFLTWAAVLGCSQEKGRGDIVSSILADKQIKSAIDYLRSGILPHQSAFLGHVYQLFDQVPFKTSEFCGEMKKVVTVIDLIRISAFCGKPVWTFLLKYTKQVMIDLATVQRPAAFKQLIKNRDVRILLLEALLPAQVKYSSIESSKSLTGSVMAVLPFDWLNKILAMVESEEEREEIVQLCIQIGYWQVCIKLLTQVGQWQRLLQLIVSTNDITLLTGHHGEDAYIPRTVEEWKYLLQCFQEINSKEYFEIQSDKPDNAPSNLQNSEPNFSSDESNLSQDLEVQTGNLEQHYESFLGNSPKEDASQDTAMTWSSLGYLLLRHLGGAAAIELLMDHLSDPLVASKCLSTDFLNACYVDFSMKMEQDHITHEMLEKVSMYMWAKKPGFVPPSVYHAVRSEKRSLENNTGEDVTLQGVFSQIKSTESQDLMAEYLGGHWGQEVNVSGCCPTCNVPLKSVMSLSVQGVTIFPCGHAFHKCCVNGTSCPLIH